MKRTTTLLKAMRQKRALSQEALEAASGVPQATIWALESRGPTRGIVHAIAIAKALNTSVEELFGGDVSARASTAVRSRRREPRAVAD